MTITARDLIPVIGYIRVSLAREEMISPEIQKAAITSWAARNGRRIVAWVPDLDKSGRNFKRRVMEAIEHVESGRAVEIAVYRYDRWGRNAVESLANVKRVEMVGGQVQSATEPFDVETAIGKYSRTNAFALAEMQSDLIGENWKAAQTARVERGLPSAGTPRFGYVRLGRVLDEHAVSERFRYRRDPTDPKGERYEPDWEGGTADYHVHMYHLYVDDEYGYDRIAQWLNDRGSTNVRGNRWSDKTVKTTMDSGFAAGYLRIHDPECKKCRKPSDCPRRIYVPGAQPPIISEELWQRYLQKRDQRRRMPPASRNPKYPLTGLIFCGHCGSPMSIQSSGGMAGYSYRCVRWNHYRDCNAAFPRRALVESEVVGELRSLADEIERERATVTVARPAPPPAELGRKRLEHDLTEVDAALRRLAIQRATDEHMPDEIYEAARDELLDRRTELERSLGELDDVDQVDPVELVPVMHELVNDWEIIPVHRRRELLGALLRHVLVYREPEGPRIVVTPRWEVCECQRCAVAA